MEKTKFTFGGIMTKNLIEIYSTRVCPYCDRAKMLLQARGLDFVEYKIDEDTSRRQEMLSRCNARRTVPQIIINGQDIGGFDDLRQLDLSGTLDKMLTNTGENHD